MNKYQEALTNLRVLEREYNFKNQNQVAPQINFDILQEIVDKTTLKKPVKTIYNLGISKQEVFTCSCGENAGDKLIGWSYCPSCGQAIDWSDENV